jgi:hypothetical protein
MESGAINRSMHTSAIAGRRVTFLLSILAGTAALLLLSFLIATSRASIALHNADSLIPVFVSLDHWSPFYWGQDRFGMLLALIALPVRDSFSNLVFQNALSVLLLLLGVLSVHRRVGNRAAFAFTLVSCALLIAMSPPEIFRMLFTTDQSYVPALGLSGIALWCSTSSNAARRLLTGPILILAAWTNVGVALFVLLYAATLTLRPWSRRSAALIAAWSAVGMAIHYWMQTLAPDQTTEIAPPVWSEAPLMLSRFFIDTYVMGGLVFWSVLLALWLFALWSSFRLRNVWPAARDTLVCSLIASIVYGMSMALFASGLPRHMMAAVPLLYVLPLVVTAQSLPRAATVASLAAVPVMLAVGLLIGVQNPKDARRALTEVLGQGLQNSLYGHRVVAVTGDYWSVWPLVFATNLLHEQMDGSRPVLPIALRADILRSRWRDTLRPDMAVAIIPAEDRLYWTVQPDLPPLHTVEKHTTWTLALTGEHRE